MSKVKLQEMSIKVVQHLHREGRWLEDEGRYEREEIVTTIVRSPIDLGINSHLAPHEMEQILSQHMASL